MSQQINLLTRLSRKKSGHFSVKDMSLALLLVVLGAGAFYGYAAYQVNRLARLSVETDQHYALEQARMSKLQTQYSPQESSRLLEEQLKQTLARATAQQAVVETLKNGALGNTTGYSEYMRAFSRQVVNGLWLTGFDIVGDAAQMSMSGGVLSPDLLPAYVQRLSRENVMRGKSFATMQMEQPKSESGRGAHYYRFTMQSVEADSDKPGKTQ